MIKEPREKPREEALRQRIRTALRQGGKSAPTSYKYIIEYRQSARRHERGFFVRAAGNDLSQVSTQAEALLLEAIDQLTELEGRVCCGDGDHDLDECQERVKAANRE